MLVFIFISVFFFFSSSFAARPGFERPEGDSSSTISYMEPIPMTESGHLPADFVMEDPDSHFIYVCKKVEERDPSNKPIHPLEADIL